jgi:hypothetical protein
MGYWLSVRMSSRAVDRDVRVEECAKKVKNSLEALLEPEFLLSRLGGLPIAMLSIVVVTMKLEVDMR